jgi:acetyl esterase/lipase
MSLACLLIAASQPAGALVSPNNELRFPDGVHARKPPTGWVILIHGGGWSLVGKAAVVALRPQAEFFRSRGWGTYNIDYRKGVRSLADVLSAYDKLRRRVGTATPICAWGGSAGGHLALLLAAYRPSVACVISEAGPTNLVRYPSEPAYAPPGVPRTTGPRWVMRTFIVPAFGSTRSSLWRWSPVRVARRIRAYLLLGSSTWDELVPQRQMLDMQRARPRKTKVMLLPGSAIRPLNFAHASITRAALAAWNRAEVSLLQKVRLSRRRLIGH